MADRLVVRGAREHNLRGVDIDLPRDSLIVFTGLSGSGKSSLAFDTIFAEGQRRYVESLSAYARQFLGQMDKPDVDFIEGLSPAVSIDQKSTSRNPRSTVGTITEIYDYLRLLYARAGTPHCPVCGELDRQADPAADRRPGAGDGGGHPVPGARAGDPRAQGRVRRPVRSTCSPQGYSRARRRRHGAPAHRAAEAQEAGEAPDRGGRRPAGGQGELQAAPHRLGRDRAAAGRRHRRCSTSSTCDEDDPTASAASPRTLACPNGHPLAIEELEPRSFSFNSPFGACPECTGLGIRKEVDPELVVPDGELSLADGAIAPWSGGQTAEYFIRLLEVLAEAMGFSDGHAVGQLPARGAARRCWTASTSRCTSATRTATAASARTTPSSRASSRS